MSLSLEAVSAGYSGIPIVREVTLEVEAGEVLALVGRNGVGKTTLVNTIAGLIEATGGRIIYKGPLWGFPVFARGTCPAERRLCPRSP